jgi:hypothetical protein
MTQFLAFYRIPSVVAQVGAFNDTVVTCSQLASNECMSMLVAGNNICKYGPDRVKDFCATAGLKLVIRAHECVQDGYQYFASCHLITVFSATNYCARHGNDGAFLEISIDRGQVCGASFTICLVLFTYSCDSYLSCLVVRVIVNHCSSMSCLRCALPKRSDLIAFGSNVRPACVMLAGH